MSRTEEIFISGAKKQVVYTLLIIVALYFFASFLGYRMIWATSEIVKESQQEVIDQVESGNTFIHPQIRRHNESLAEYERTKRMVQTFWLSYFFDFPEFEKLVYEQFKPRMDQIKNE